MPTAAAAVENIPEKCIWQSSPSFYYIIIRPTKGKVYNADRKFSLMSRVSQDCCVVVYSCSYTSAGGGGMHCTFNGTANTTQS